MQRDCPKGGQGGGGKGGGYPGQATQFNGYGKGGIRALNMLETILPATEKEEEEVLDWIIPEMTMAPPPMARAVETGKGENTARASAETGKGENMASSHPGCNPKSRTADPPLAETGKGEKVDIEGPPLANDNWQVAMTRANRKKQRKILDNCSDGSCKDKCCHLGMLETIFHPQSRLMPLGNGRSCYSPWTPGLQKRS